MEKHTPELLEALKLALPYVEKVAATAPTEMLRQQRQRQASKDASIIRAAIAEAKGPELLEALKAIVANDFNMTEGARRIIRAAIAKAKETN